MKSKFSKNIYIYLNFIQNAKIFQKSLKKNLKTKNFQKCKNLKKDSFKKGYIFNAFPL